MNTYFLRISACLLLMTTLFSSCEKQLEIAPRQSIDAETALTSREAIEASITSIYATLKSARLYGRDFIALPEALADNGFATNKSGRLLPEAQNNLGANFTTTVWTASYQAINQINLTLAAIPTLNLLPAVDATERARWEGELYFLRGLYYFNLVRIYSYIPGAVVAAQSKGGVVISTQGFSGAAAALAYRPSRSPIDSVYLQINSDLVAANARLLNPGLGANRANKIAAQGLLSIVNLYSKDYTAAKRWSDSCITLGASRITTPTNYITQWRGETNQETLFQVRFATSGENIGVNESLQTSFTTLITPGNQALTGGFGDLVPTIPLLNEFGIGLQGGMTTANFALGATVATRTTDVRNLMYEVGTSGRGPAKVECTKFLGKNGFLNLDNVPVQRISEIYLNRAEAFATAGSPVFNLASALADLKFIKSRRYTDYTGSAQEANDNVATQAVLYEEILRQRRIELAFEGARFFDLKRLGRDLVKAPHYNTVAFTDTRILPALPLADVQGNLNLIQNQGY